MSIISALKARREALRDSEAGFTLIELLVVVIIIGILAAIAIPIYIGVQNNARDAGVKSDLANDKTAVVAYYTNSGTSVALSSSNFNAATLGTYGWAAPTAANYSTSASAPTYAATSSTSSFCLQGISASGTTWSVTSSGSVASGACGAASTW